MCRAAGRDARKTWLPRASDRRRRWRPLHRDLLFELLLERRAAAQLEQARPSGERGLRRRLQRRARGECAHRQQHCCCLWLAAARSFEKRKQRTQASGRLIPRRTSAATWAGRRQTLPAPTQKMPSDLSLRPLKVLAEAAHVESKERRHPHPRCIRCSRSPAHRPPRPLPTRCPTPRSRARTPTSPHSRSLGSRCASNIVHPHRPSALQPPPFHRLKKPPPISPLFSPRTHTRVGRSTARTIRA